MINPNISKLIEEYQVKINREIEIFFNREINIAKNNFQVETLKILKEFSLRPAKRMRAILVNYGYLLANGKNQKQILKISVFIELLHNYLLIHDDIIDREELRRGKPTLHRIYKNHITIKNIEGEHYGLSMAISAGDLMDILSRKIITESGIPDKTILKITKKIDEVLEHTVYGQMLELWVRKRMLENKNIKEKDILEIYKNKTAFYTFVGPLQIGAILAHANTKTLNLLEKIGLPLGIAFQINDDLQEIFKESVGSDIKEAKPSLLIAKTISHKRGRGLRRYFDRAISKKDLEVIKKIIIDSGSYKDCIKTGFGLINKAKNNIIMTKLPSKNKDIFLGLADYILETN